MEQEGEGRSAADTARESRQHEERAAGPAAQFTHHETASTTISSQLISAAPGKSPKPHSHHTTHTEQPPTTPVTRRSEPSAIHDAAKKYPAIPPSTGHGAQLNVVTRGAPHPQEKTLGVRTPSSSLLLMATEEDNSNHTQLPACTTKGAFKSTATCIFCVCVVVCACRNTTQRSRKEGAEYVEGRTKMY
ncbi:hypothetical protein MOQ_009369, partial [Trypanosoma cruzi marinkellei]